MAAEKKASLAAKKSVLAVEKRPLEASFGCYLIHAELAFLLVVLAALLDPIARFPIAYG